MEPEECGYMLTLLRPFAEEAPNLGADACKWESVRGRLAQRFNESYLDRHSTQIFDLFVNCLLTHIPSDNSSFSVLSQKARVPPTYASAAPPASSSLSQSIEGQSPSRLSPSATSKPTVDEGFIRIGDGVYDGARFSYSWKEDNIVGWHILKRNELLPQVQQNKIWLTFFLESKPKKTYKLEFKTKKKASFDVSLGTKWKDEGEAAEENVSEAMIRRPLNEPWTYSPLQSMNNGSCGCAIPPPPEYLSSLLLPWFPGANPPQAVQTPKRPLVPRTSQAPSCQGLSRGRQENQSATRAPQFVAAASAAPVTAIPPTILAATDCYKPDSDESTSSEIFDKEEDGGDHFSESSAPDSLDDDRAQQYWGTPLESLEEECCKNVWA